MLRVLFAFLVVLACVPSGARAQVAVQAYALPSGGGFPHDVAVGSDGIVWYTAQRDGKLGRLDPATGKVELVSLGAGAAPHGVVVGPDGAPWVTEGGHNAIVRVDPKTREVKSWSLPAARGYVNLNTAAFDNRGRIWFTGQNGIYGRLDPKTGAMQVWDAPQGRGPYGIAATPDGVVYYASLAGSHIARLDPETGAATVIEPPT
ncbi:MAG: lyase, partial [Candidatus Rokubacteria bacterium]|nr:lyase [Candidatus Rokubacteria bacterium]